VVVLFERLAGWKEMFSRVVVNLCDEGEVVLLLLCAGKQGVKVLSLDQRCIFSHDVGFVRMPSPVSLLSWSLVDGHTGAAHQRADRNTDC